MRDTDIEDSYFVFLLKINTAQSLTLNFAFIRAASDSFSKSVFVRFDVPADQVVWIHIWPLCSCCIDGWLFCFK